MAFSLVKNGNEWIIQGDLDESADLSPLATAPSPIKINFKGLQATNSVGLGRLLSLVLNRFDARFEYHECPPHFVETINTISRLLGPKNDPRVVKSVIMPFECPGCQAEATQTLKMEHVRMEGSTFQMDGQPCAKCRILLRLAVDPDDFFLFLTYKAT